jgi:hypothetical protein
MPTALRGKEVPVNNWEKTKKVSQGKTHDLCPIYPRHLLSHLPDGYWALSLFAFSPDVSASYAFSACQAGTLLTASFRFRVDPDAIAIRLTVPSIKARRGLAPPSHRLGTTPSRLVPKKNVSFLTYKKKRTVNADPLFCSPSFAYLSP